MMISSIDHLAGLSGSCPLIVYDQITPVQYEVLSGEFFDVPNVVWIFEQHLLNSPKILAANIADCNTYKYPLIYIAADAKINAFEKRAEK